LGSGSFELEMLTNQEVTAKRKSAEGEAVGVNIYNCSENDSGLDMEPVSTDPRKDCLISLINENWNILPECTHMALVSVVRSIIEIHCNSAEQ